MNSGAPPYPEKVYAGVLGKIIGVYLGRPFEGWSHKDIVKRFGRIETYVHELLDVPLVVTDDDITGTFTFVRALEDHAHSRDLTAAQIGQCWLNTIIENRSILWWGGFGVSTEHTAYLRLKDGVEAPASGSTELNGATVAEQIGSQIFIDSWGLVSPGNPTQAAEFACKAASVSHDGAAIHGAQMVAAMVAQAFVANSVDALIDAGLATIPADCLIARMIADIRDWHRDSPDDWEANFHRIEDLYGYDRYGGNCHMVPNHALIILALLHGRGDIQESLMIVNTCGWDTDCNSGNVGCILGVMRGLEGFASGFDFRDPVADRLFLPQADGGRCVTDAVRETYALVNSARSLDGLQTLAPKGGARFHFSLPGSVQGFEAVEDHTNRGHLRVANTACSDSGVRSLALHYHGLARGCSVYGATRTWLTPEDLRIPGYPLDACPTLYPGQTVTARLTADCANTSPVNVTLAAQVCDGDDRLAEFSQDATAVMPGKAATLTWTIPETGGQPIVRIGLRLRSPERGEGSLFLDTLTWSGAPDLALPCPEGSKACEQAWISDAPTFGRSWQRNAWWMTAHDRRGLAYTGSRDWTDYRIRGRIEAKLADAFGLLARVQGLRRYYALELTRDQTLRLTRMLDKPTVLAEVAVSWEPEASIAMEFRVSGHRLIGLVDGAQVIAATDAALTEGAAGMTATTGMIFATDMEVRPIENC